MKADRTVSLLRTNAWPSHKTGELKNLISAKANKKELRKSVDSNMKVDWKLDYQHRIDICAMPTDNTKSC